jgi:hypothetical protein
MRGQLLRQYSVCLVASKLVGCGVGLKGACVYMHPPSPAFGGHPKDDGTSSDSAYAGIGTSPTSFGTL